MRNFFNLLLFSISVFIASLNGQQAIINFSISKNCIKINGTVQFLILIKVDHFILEIAVNCLKMYISNLK